MSDFTSNFWSIYVAAITLAGILGCLWLLWYSGRTEVPADSDNTTGHVWDGDLREMNNPLPRWWVGLFLITCIFSLAYLVLYPGLGAYPGVLKWTSVGEMNDEIERGNAQVAPVYAAFAGKSTADLAKDPAAMVIGERLFLNNCAQCHGSDARGSTGFPNLTDGDWLWGGSPEKIHETIVAGRQGIMTPMVDAVGTSDDVRNLANYVLSLSGAPHDSLRAGLGKSKFVACVACHGDEGKGKQELGAPDLTDKVWLLGPGVESHVVNMITKGYTGVMPAWEHKFTPEQLKVLTAYVWGLGGGVSASAAAQEPAPAATQPATEAPAQQPQAAPEADSASVVVEDGVIKFYFASGKTDLAAGADQALAAIVAGVQEGKKAIISGYVDSTGNAAQNEELAKVRAQAVRDQLIALGVAQDMIELQKPDDINAGASAQARRVEVTLQ